MSLITIFLLYIFWPQTPNYLLYRILHFLHFSDTLLNTLTLHRPLITPYSFETLKDFAFAKHFRFVFLWVFWILLFFFSFLLLYKCIPLHDTTQLHQTHSQQYYRKLCRDENFDKHEFFLLVSLKSFRFTATAI